MKRIVLLVFLLGLFISCSNQKSADTPWNDDANLMHRVDSVLKLTHLASPPLKIIKNRPKISYFRAILVA